MEIYEEFIRMIVERYFYDQLYEVEYIKITPQAIDKIIETLLKDDEFTEELDFVVINRIEKGNFVI